MRNVLAQVPKGHAEMVAAAVRTVFAQPSPVHVRDQLEVIAAMLGRQFPKVEAMLRDASDDITAFASFPVGHWKKIWSNNPQVISSPAADVRDVADEQVSAPHLRSGRGYLWPVQHAASGGIGVRSAGDRERLAA